MLSGRDWRTGLRWGALRWSALALAAALSVATALLGLFVALGIAQGASIFYFPLVTGIVIINTAVAILLSEWFLKRFYNL